MIEEGRFTKKPVTVEAMRWTDERPMAELAEFANDLVRLNDVDQEFFVYDRLHDTWVQFQYGDWIIKGVKGEFYPCVDETFQATYSAVVEECDSECADCEEPKAKKGLVITDAPMVTFNPYGGPPSTADIQRQIIDARLRDPYRR
jgi:hypothetical protein